MGMDKVFFSVTLLGSPANFRPPGVKKGLFFTPDVSSKASRVKITFYLTPSRP